MIETVIKLLPQEPGANVGVYSENEALVEAVHNYMLTQDGSCHDLRKYRLSQLPFGGEYFESIILDGASVLEDERIVLQVKRGIQKNRYVIVLSNDVNHWRLSEMLEPYGFSNFSTIEEGSLNINLFKKWFAL